MYWFQHSAPILTCVTDASHTIPRDSAHTDGGADDGPVSGRVAAGRERSTHPSPNAPAAPENACWEPARDDRSAWHPRDGSIGAEMTERIEVPDDPRDLPGPFRHRAGVEVRFRDTDAMGHVNNAVYHTYVELGRTSYLDDVLERPLRLGTHGETSFILAESRMVHRSPVFFGEMVTVGADV